MKSRLEKTDPKRRPKLPPAITSRLAELAKSGALHFKLRSPGAEYALLLCPLCDDIIYAGTPAWHGIVYVHFPLGQVAPILGLLRIQNKRNKKCRRDAALKELY